MNHGKSNSPVAYCPNCGERFKSVSVRGCTVEKHKERRKGGNIFCYDCGKNLTK